MKKIMRLSSFSIVALLLAFALVAPAFSGENKDSAETAQTKEIVLALFEAFNRHDVEALVEAYAEDVKIISPGDTEPRSGREVVREIYQGHFDDIPGVHDAVQNIVAEGNRAAVEFIATWEQPTEDDLDARGSLRIAAFLKIRDGLVVEDFTYFDRMALMPPGLEDQAE